MNINWRKVWRDLSNNKARTILVILAMAIGINAVGITLGMSEITRTHMTETHQAAIMAHIRFWMINRFDEDIVDQIISDAEIVDAEGISQDQLRWRLEGESEWNEMRLISRLDYNAQRMNGAELLAGEWPGDETLTVERLTSNYYSVSTGTVIEVDCGDHICSVPVSGVARGQIVPPPDMTGEGTFYATPQLAAALTGLTEGFDGLMVRLETFTPEGAEQAALRVRQYLEAQGLSLAPEGYYITDPEVHWAQDQFDTVMMIMGLMGFGSLLFGGFLIVNTLNAIIARQVWQVGVMKVFGATAGRVVRIYMLTALLHGLVALLIAAPTAAFVAYQVSITTLDSFNVPLESFQVSLTAILVQIAVAVIVPLLAALTPAIAGARKTAREAMSSRGLGDTASTGPLDRIAGRIRSLPRPLVLGVRNTFRSKARVALTLSTLVLGGVMFVVVMSIKDSMDNTFDSLFSDLGHDVLIQLDRPYGVSEVERAVAEVPESDFVEVWSGSWAAISMDDDHLREMFLWAIPANSEMFSPRLVAGRNLDPQDENAILLNRRTAEDEGIQVGDDIQLVVQGQQSTWTVVGLVVSMRNGGRESFVPMGALAEATAEEGRGNLVLGRTVSHDGETQLRVGNALASALSAAGINSVQVDSAVEEREGNQTMFDGVVYILIVCVTLVTIVGCLGLAGTMSITVIERAREIGMMRAIGATSGTVVLAVIGEGLFIGLLSWLLAIPLSYPSAYLFGNAIADTLIHMPMEFSYSIQSTLLWLLVVVVISSLASFLPALRATRVSVRQSLAYE
jgi:putative ABC transport system permease protein